MSKWGRSTWIKLAGVATLLLTIWTMVQNEDEPVSEMQTRKPSRRVEQQPSVNESVAKGGTEPIESLRLDLLVRDKSTMEKIDPFALPVIRKPKIIAPPPPPPEPVVVPTAPPMPFSYFGSYEEGGKQTVMLVRDNKIYNAVESVNLDATYRVEKVGANKIEIMYLPLGITQRIDTNESAVSSKK